MKTVIIIRNPVGVSHMLKMTLDQLRHNMETFKAILTLKGNSYRVGLVPYPHPPVETGGYVQATLTALYLD